GVAREDRVALLVDRCVDAVAAILGVWKAGAAFLPLAPTSPAARLSAMVDEVGAACLIVGAGAGDLGVSCPALRLDEIGDDDAPRAPPASPPPTPDQLAYVIYTSGSTGRPKGVAVEHGQLAAYAEAIL